MSHADILHARHVPGAASGRAADGTASKRQNLATQAARAETGPLGAGVDAKARLSRAGNNGDSALTPPCWVKRGESVINGQGKHPWGIL